MKKSGELLIALRDAPDLNCVDAKGVALTGKPSEIRKKTFGGICRELNTPPSTAYYHIDVAITTSKYPQAIQDAAAEAGLNLALDWVVARYDELVKAGLPEKPTAYELKGIIADLETAKKPTSTTTTKSKGVARFQELIEEAFDYAKDEELDPAEELISLFGRVFRLTDKLQVQAADIRFAMGQAAKESLTKAGFETWQAVVHQLATDEKAAKAAGAAAGAGTASVPGDVFGLNASVPADAAAANKP